MRFQRYLTEKTYRINEDIKYIYESSGMKNFMNKLKKDNLPAGLISNILNNDNIVFKEFSSGDLKTKDSKAAHLVNPVKILVGIFPGATYKPQTKEIFVGPPQNPLQIVLNKKVEIIDKSLLNVFENELTETRIKATIAHELSHWISDSTHNFHLSKLVSIADELKSGEIMKLHQKDVNMTYFEIDAIIHGMKAVRSKIGRKKWDTLTFDKASELYPSLWSVMHNLKQYGNDIVKLYRKLVLKRMAREKLLGKSMRG